MTTYHVRPDGLPPVNGYSHVVAGSGTIIHVSGQVPARADGSVVDPHDVEAQVEQVFTNLRTALAAASATFSDVVKMTIYLTDMADLPTLRIVRNRHLVGERLPASSLVQVAALVNPQFRVEIDAVALI
jgi:enamine deaminase RidA (YjgF/YER057c/UK114 family)